MRMKELLIIVGMFITIVWLYKNNHLNFEMSESNKEDYHKGIEEKEEKKKRYKEEERIEAEKEDEARKQRNKESLVRYAVKYEREKLKKKVASKVCTKCGGAHLTPMKQGYGVGKTALGVVVAGPIGLAAGGINKNKIKLVCNTCGSIKK